MVIDLGRPKHTDPDHRRRRDHLASFEFPIGGNSFTEAPGQRALSFAFEKAEDPQAQWPPPASTGRQILQAHASDLCRPGPPRYSGRSASYALGPPRFANYQSDASAGRWAAPSACRGLQKYLQQNLQLEVQKIDRLGNTPPHRFENRPTALSENVPLGRRGPMGWPAARPIGNGKITSSLAAPGPFSRGA